MAQKITSFTDNIVTIDDTKMQVQENEIVLYQPNDTIHLEVRMVNESVWLTQSQIALLFGVKQPAISKHLNNIFKSGELDENSVHSILEYTAADGKFNKTRYNATIRNTSLSPLTSSRKPTTDSSASMTRSIISGLR